MLQDLRFGWRLLVRQRSTTLVALFALALGIGANSAIFSVLNTLLLSPLPYRDPNRLIVLRENVPAVSDVLPLTDAEALALRERAHRIGPPAIADLLDYTLVERGEPENVPGARVTTDFFRVLGVKPARGRLFVDEDGRAGGPAVVVLSHRIWSRYFGSDPNLVGRSIRLTAAASYSGDESEATRYTVVGILPDEFRSPFEHEEIWAPLALDPAQADHVLHIKFPLARLATGTTLEAARNEIATILGSIDSERPIHKNAGRSATVYSLPDFNVRNVRRGLLLLAVAVGLVLLIACTNVASLKLAQSVEREREVALRASLGASRGRLVRQMLVEGLLLGLLGGALGLLLAFAILHLLVATNEGSISRFDEIGLNGTVLAFTLAVAVLSGLAVGLAPAFRGARPRLFELLQQGGRSGASASHLRLRGVLVVVQVAIALVVSISAGLLARSFHNLQSIPYGFDSHHVLTAEVALPQSKYKEVPQYDAFFRALLDRLHGLAGVRAVGLANTIPMTRVNSATPLEIEGRAAVEGETLTANYRLVSPEYFAALKVPLVAGRGLTTADLGNPPRALLVDREFVRKYLPDGDPLGHRLVLGGVDQPVAIVGVVGNVIHKAMSTEPRPTFYLPWLNSPTMTLLLRTDGDPARLSTSVRTALRSLEPALPVEIATFDQVAIEAVARPRFNAFLMSLLAAIALLIAAIGLFGLMLFTVTQRHREMGIRLALGSDPRELVGQIVRRGLVLAAIGAAVGLVGARLATRYVESQLYDLAPTDPWIYLGATGLLLVVAFLASLLPALRAARVDPRVVLHSD